MAQSVRPTCGESRTHEEHRTENVLNWMINAADIKNMSPSRQGEKMSRISEILDFHNHHAAIVSLSLCTDFLINGRCIGLFRETRMYDWVVAL